LKMVYTAHGNTVGLGQRMEQLATPDQVYLTEQSALAVLACATPTARPAHRRGAWAALARPADPGGAPPRHARGTPADRRRYPWRFRTG
jgi:class 3 adenylate cyclase